MVPINQVILGGDPLLGSSMVGNRWWTNQVQLAFDKQEIGIKYVGFGSFQGNINY